jgi:hypothetical protein
MPENIPKGAAINKAVIVIVKVLTRAGNRDTFSDVYLNANKSHDICGTPFINIYIKIPATAINVITAEIYTMLLKKIV